MEIRFKECEAEDVARLLIQVYHLKDGLEDVVDNVKIATRFVDVCHKRVEMVITNGYMYATVPSAERGELFGVIELVGIITSEGRRYVYEFK